jgi:hypothetical protein
MRRMAPHVGRGGKMNKILVPFFLFLFAFVPTTHAGSGEFNDIWLFTRDHVLDGILNPTDKKDEVKLPIRLNSHHNKFSGEYVEIRNDSVFIGETHTARGTTLIVFIQYDETFYAIHVGRKIGDDHYAGTWYAVGNQAGDFELRKK